VSATQAAVAVSPAADNENVEGNNGILLLQKEFCSSSSECGDHRAIARLLARLQTGRQDEQFGWH